MAFRIAVVCLGNICRSPTADVVLNAKLRAAGLDDRIEVTSCGTASWHVGKPMDPRSADVLRNAGYDPDRHRAQTFGAPWFDHDLILVMDAANRDDVLAQLPPAAHSRVVMFRAYDPQVPDADPRSGYGPDVPDPWAGGPAGFDEVLAITERTSEAIVASLHTT